MDDVTISQEKKGLNINFKKIMGRYGIYFILLFMIVAISLVKPVFLSQYLNRQRPS